MILHVTKASTLVIASLLLISCGTVAPAKIDSKSQTVSGTTLPATSNVPTNTSTTNSNINVSQPVEIVKTTQDTTTMNESMKSDETLVEVVKQVPALVIASCESYLNKENTTEQQKNYEYWVKLLKKFYPTFNTVSVGQACTLKNGQILVTAALANYVEYNKKPADNKFKKVILFDAKHRHIASTTGFTCDNVGDISIPFIDPKQSLTDNILDVTCNGGDAGYSVLKTVAINLNDFSFKTVKEVSTSVTGSERNGKTPVAQRTTKTLQPDGSMKEVTEDIY